MPFGTSLDLTLGECLTIGHWCGYLAAWKMPTNFFAGLPEFVKGSDRIASNARRVAGVSVTIPAVWRM